MQAYYLEIVTDDVAAVCDVYAAAHQVRFSDPVSVLGDARTAQRPDGGLVGIRGRMRPDEALCVRPYWLVADLEAAVAAAVEAGAELAHPPLELTGYGSFAIYIAGGVDHGLWQR
jgi:predicted enzyme related to lactoylglutathione lyase